MARLSRTGIISVSGGDLSRFDAVLKARGGKSALKSLAQGFNRLGIQTLSASKKALTRTYTIKKARLKGALELTRKATSTSLWVEITAFEQKGGAPNKRVPGAINFGAKQLKGKSIVTLKIKKKGGRKRLHNAVILKGATKQSEAGAGFIGPTRAKLQVFEKLPIKTVPRKGSYKGKRLKRSSAHRQAGQRMTRQKLKKVFGPSVRGMFRAVGIKAGRKYIWLNRTRILNNALSRQLAAARRTTAKR